ncbi:ATP-binding protein [Caenispirillum salinarum]|nr:ATP-binding protein [Caenispirillum salinarum]
MTRPTPSLRLRMLAGAVCWIGVALAASGWVLVDLFRDHVEAQARDRLVTDMDQLIAALTVEPDGTVTVFPPLSDPRFRQPLSGLYWQVGPVGSPVARSRSLWDAALPLPADTVRDGQVHVHAIRGPREAALLSAERLVRLPGRDAPLRVAVAQDMAEVEAAVGRFTRDLLGAFAVLAVALMLAAVAQGVVVLRPMQRLRERVLTVRRGKAERLAGAFPAEVVPLVDDLNILLDHARNSTHRARRQAGDLAHGLKTPLAVISAEAQHLAGAGQDEPAAVLMEQVEAMRRQVEANLARARAAASRDLPGARAPVAETLEPLCRTIGRLYGKAVEMDVPAGLAFKGDAQDLQEMAGALIDNAGKWGRNRIRVAARAENGVLVITIDDDGPGLPPRLREAAFQRGIRLDEAVPGTGLGLSIARDLAELYSGSVALDEGPSGTGGHAVLRLPAC